MALTFEINGTDRRANLRDGTLVIDKLFGVETLSCQVLEKSSPGASAFRPTPGQSIYVEDSGDLVFGGTIVDRREETIWQAGGVPSLTLNTLTARSYETLVDAIVVDALSVASQDLLETVDDLFTAYLSALGVTNIGATTGGPTLPALEFDHQTLASIFNQLATLSGYTWRINGDRQFAFVAPGDLTGTALSESNALDGSVVVEQSLILRATRLFLRTGGTGTVTHTESRTGNGTQSVFLLNVEPSTAPTEVDENGTIYALPSATWTYNATLKCITRASALGNGVPVSVSYPVEFPAWVRCWDASTQASSGTWTASALVDAIVEASEQTDLAQAKAWGDAELARRIAQPLVVTVRTREKGYYPLLRVTLSFPDSNVSGNYIVKSVRVEVADDNNIVYAVTCVEDDTIDDQWTAFYGFRGASSSGGVAVVGTVPGGSSGTAELPAGVTAPLGGDNYTAFTATTTWQNWPNYIPTCLPAGSYTLRTPLHLIAAGTLEARLLNQDDGTTVLASTSTTQTGTLTDQNYAYPTDTFSLATPTNVLLQYKRASGTGKAKLGQATAVRT